MSPVGSRAAGAILLLAAGASGCAPRPAPAVRPAAGAPASVSVNPSSTDIRYVADLKVAEAEVAGEPVTVWQSLVLVHRQLELPVAEADARGWVMRTGRFRAPRRIAGLRLSSFFDCGSTMTGLRTENSDVWVEVTTFVRHGQTGSSVVATAVSANARNRDGTSTAAFPCTSTGELEKLVVTRLRERLGG